MTTKDPTEETQIIRKQVGYSWSYSYEFGPTGDRQKLIITGNTTELTRAKSELKGAKINLMELAIATAEELANPHSNKTPKNNNEEGNDLLD